MLVTVHTVLVLGFMLISSRRLFASIPFDCVYEPYFWLSGPIVHTVAHAVQHLVEGWFLPEHLMLAWNVVPGLVCLILGGIQYWLLESWFIRRRRRALASDGMADANAEEYP